MFLKVLSFFFVCTLRSTLILWYPNKVLFFKMCSRHSTNLVYFFVSKLWTSFAYLWATKSCCTATGCPSRPPAVACVLQILRHACLPGMDVPDILIASHVAQEASHFSRIYRLCRKTSLWSAGAACRILAVQFCSGQRSRLPAEYVNLSISMHNFSASLLEMSEGSWFLKYV